MASRSARLVVAVVLLVAAAACGPLAGGGRSRACGALEDLDGIAAGFARTGLEDPVAFDRALGTATDRYAEAGGELRDRLPEEYREDLDRHLAAVRQYRFTDAASDRRAIDEWAAEECGRTGTVTTNP